MSTATIEHVRVPLSGKIATWRCENRPLTIADPRIACDEIKFHLSAGRSCTLIGQIDGLPDLSIKIKQPSQVCLHRVKGKNPALKLCKVLMRWGLEREVMVSLTVDATSGEMTVINSN